MSFSSSILNPMNMARYLKCEYKKLQFNIENSRRLSSKEDDPITRLKDTHKGERCFVICTGPSLTKEDVLLLKDEFTIGMNSICKLFPETDWRPSMYGVQDLLVYDKLVDDFDKFDDKTVCLVGSNISKERKIPKNWISFPLYVAYHTYDKVVRHKYYAKFTDDCHKVVYNGYSITYSILQIAAYMGFSEIYLLGADNNYSPTGKHHFIEHGHFSSDADLATFRLNAAYECAKNYADENGIKIVNVTRGGMLEVFPRKTLEEVLNKKED